ncbi:MAG: electron transport complex subunit RsxB, partial [Pseudoalteromonas distincta]
CPVDCIDMLPVAETKQNWKWQLDAIPVTQID